MLSFSCIMSIDNTRFIVYNNLVNESGQVDEAQTNRLAKLVEWLRQHGKTAHHLTKEITKMSKIELLAKIELLNKYEAMIEEMKGEADSIRNSIKAEMEAREVEELIAGQYIIRWTSVLSQRFDSTSFKKVLPELYKAYTKQVASRRFTITA